MLLTTGHPVLIEAADAILHRRRRRGARARRTGNPGPAGRPAPGVRSRPVPRRPRPDRRRRPAAADHPPDVAGRRPGHLCRLGRGVLPREHGVLGRRAVPDCRSPTRPHPGCYAHRSPPDPTRTARSCLRRSRRSRKRTASSTPSPSAVATRCPEQASDAHRQRARQCARLLRRRPALAGPSARDRPTRPRRAAGRPCRQHHGGARSDGWPRSTRSTEPATTSARSGCMSSGCPDGASRWTSAAARAATRSNADWLPVLGAYAEERCPHCGETAPLSASKTRLGCLRCQSTRGQGV